MSNGINLYQFILLQSLIANPQGLTPRAPSAALSELQGAGLVVQSGDVYKITETGKKAVYEIVPEPEFMKS